MPRGAVRRGARAVQGRAADSARGAESFYEAAALNNVGYIYLSLGRYDEAQTYLQQAVTIRERLNVPADVADTLHNLAEVSVRTGAYEPAQGQYLKALELWRKVGNQRAAGLELNDLGEDSVQGRFGAAIDSKAEALKLVREIAERDSSLPKVLGSYGGALARVAGARTRSEPWPKPAPGAAAAQRRAGRGDPEPSRRCAVLGGDFKSARSLTHRPQPWP